RARRRISPRSKGPPAAAAGAAGARPGGIVCVDRAGGAGAHLAERALCAFTRDAEAARGRPRPFPARREKRVVSGEERMRKEECATRSGPPPSLLATSLFAIRYSPQRRKPGRTGATWVHRDRSRSPGRE